MRPRVPLIILFIILVQTHLPAQPNHSFINFAKEKGLASSTMQDIVQDPDGFLWLASWGGIYRFDGDHFINFKTDAVNEQGNPRSNRFIDLEADQYGRIWALSYDNYLYYMDRRRNTLVTVKTGRHSVQQLFSLPSGRVCMLSADNTLLFPAGNDGQGSVQLEESRLIPEGITLYSLFQDPKGYLWLMTSGGLYREREQLVPDPVFTAMEWNDTLYFGAAEGKIVISRNGEITEKQTALHSDITLLTHIPGQEAVLVGSTAEEVWVYDMSLQHSQSAGKPCYPVGELHSVEDGRGNLWIYSASGGLDWYDSERQQLVPFFDKSVQQRWDHESRIGCVMMDNQGDLWISSFPGGLEEVVFSQGGFHFQSFASFGNTASAGNVRSLCQYGDHFLLAGTRDGKVHLLDSSFVSRTSFEFASSAYTLAQNPDGTVWVGTRESGLAEIAPESSHLVIYQKNDDYYGSNANQIYCVKRDDNERLWIASFDGSLSYLDLTLGGRSFISRKNRLSFPNLERNRLRCIRFGEDGRLYTGGTIGLFTCDNPQDPPEQLQFTQFSKIQNYDIQDILLTRQGRLYACSYGNGFLAFDSPDPNSGFKEYTVEDGFLSNFILSAVEDSNGTIWIATEGGLNRFDPATGSIVGYSYERLGFPMRFNEGTILQTTDGRLFFNTTSGIFYFHPEEVAISSYVPELHILSCRAGKHDLSPDTSGPIRLRASERLELEFSAIDMAAPGRVHYSYRIDGTDQDWISIGTMSQLSLGPFHRGKHQIRLRSTNGDGVSVDNVRLLEVQAAPYPLSSSWAILVYILGGATASLILLIRNRRRVRQSLPEDNPYLKDLQGDDRKLIEDLLAFLETRLDDGSLDMDAMADTMHMSRSALFKKTKALTGHSPMDLLRELRFDRARSLVASGGYSIAQIAYMTGFNDAHYFSKVFKKETGMTPTEYRNHHDA